MVNTGYPYEGFEDMFPETRPTPEWRGFGHKHYEYHKAPVRRIILVDGQEHQVIDTTDPDQPLDYAVSDMLQPYPVERPHFPVSTILSINRTERPGARPGMESGQFEQPDTRPGVILHHFFGRQVTEANPHASKRRGRR